MDRASKFLQFVSVEPLVCIKDELHRKKIFNIYRLRRLRGVRCELHVLLHDRHRRRLLHVRRRLPHVRLHDEHVQMNELGTYGRARRGFLA